MRVGVFDSGVGGISVLKSLVNARLFDEIIYFGDTARVPYGVKDKNTIIRYSLEALEFFKNFKIDMFIVACNSVSAYALKELQESSCAIVLGVIEPGVLALQKKIEDRDAKILVLGTKATIKSQKYQNLLSLLGYTKIEQKATGLFVPIVEEGIFSGKVLDALLEHYFCDLTTTPDAIILGCTHFPLIAKEISKYFNNTPLIHSGDAIVEHIKEKYGINSIQKDTKIQYFASENPQALKDVADIWLST